MRQGRDITQRVSSAPTSSSPAKILYGVFSKSLSASMKWLWSLKTTTYTAITGRSMVKFESGYTVETVFDGSKLGIEPHTVELRKFHFIGLTVAVTSDIDTRPRLVAGSPEGYPGHIDGKSREARMNHPKGLAVDDRGNIYIADTMNMAIRKISDAGVTTIAGGKLSLGGGHVDRPSEDAKFSDDFDVVYVGSSCSLLVIDRGNRAIREIQLHFDDCAYQYGSGFPLGIAVLIAAGFFGYMLALLQRRVGTIVSSQNVNGSVQVNAAVSSPNQKPVKSVRPPLTPTEDEHERQEEGFIGPSEACSQRRSVGSQIMGGVFPGFRKKSLSPRPQQPMHSTHWPAQESNVIPDKDEPPTPRKTYPFMSKDAEKIHQLCQSRVFYHGWDADVQHQDHLQKQHRYQSSAPHTYYEQSHEKTNEVVFGAVQEQDRKREAMLKTAADGDNTYDRHNICFQSNSSFHHGYKIHNRDKFGVEKVLL
ncbi:NHL domain-containing protein isoform 2 [Hibiscus syriacus]|uniref:NHL domain-containing protein isoform 2 n=1 Tax=Hibiscus syriacus TaxID=106335 RepID=A0A6A3B4I3_HIBSY|nr:NHL domain-containing protein isoform 2 [Hibiscus syriacus]